MAREHVYKIVAHTMIASEKKIFPVVNFIHMLNQFMF